MLITKEVEIKWGSKNKSYFKERGYIYTKMRDSFMVKVEHLQSSNPVKVDVICDYCYKPIQKRWADYLRERTKIKKDSCCICRYKKEKEKNVEKNKNNLLEVSDKKYFSIKSNRLKHLKEYIELYGNVDNMRDSQEGSSLYNSIVSNRETPMQLAKELGYDLESISSRLPHGYIMEFPEIKERIEKFIAQNNRFPSYLEIKNDLRIRPKQLYRYGNIYKIKRMMNYNEKNDLIDKSGFYNSSMYELTVANILIESGISYLREEYPFKDHKYRSDFTFHTDEEQIHLEVWGYSRNGKGKIISEYAKIRAIKEGLYKKNNIKYISIEPSIFNNGRTYLDIQSDIVKILNENLPMKINEVPYEIIIPSRKLTDDKLFEKVMSIAIDDNTPTVSDLQNNGLRYIYNEIVKRHKYYRNFIGLYGKKTGYNPNNYWTDEKIFTIFRYMIDKYGRILGRREVNKLKDNDEMIRDISKIFSVIGKICSFGSLNNLKLEFFKECLNLNKHIPQLEVDWIKKMSINKTRRGNSFVDEEYQNLATELINTINIKKVS